MEDRGRKASVQRRRERLAPLRLKAVLAQRFVLGAELLVLLLVGSDAEAADPAKRIAHGLGETVERPFGGDPVVAGDVTPKPLAGVAIGHRSAAKGEAAVPATRAFGNASRLVHPNPEAGLRERERSRAARDPGTDDLDVRRSVEPFPDQFRAWLFQPV